MRGATKPWVDRWRAGVLIVAFALALPVAYAGPLGFVPLAVTAGVLSPPALLQGRRSLWTIAPLLALAAWALVSLAWSPAAADLGAVDSYAAAEAVTVVKLFLLLLVLPSLALAGDRLSEPAARVVGGAVLFSTAALALALLAEGLNGAGFYRWIRETLDDPIRPDLAIKNVAQGGYAFAVLAFPATFALMRARGWGAGAAVLGMVAGAAASLMLGAFAPAAALLAGGLAYGLVAAWPRVGALTCALAVAAFSLAAPFLARLIQLPNGAPASWSAREAIWRFAADRTLERPWLGWGLDASRTFGPAVPLHPHNAALQLWLELGVVGAALFALFWAAVFWFAGRLAEEDAPAGGMWAATAAAYLAIGFLSFGVWQEWWLCLGALAFAAALAVRRGWPRGAARARDALQPIA